MITIQDILVAIITSIIVIVTAIVGERIIKSDIEDYTDD